MPSSEWILTMYNLNIRRRLNVTKAEEKKPNITLLIHRKWCHIFQAVLMYSIAINKIIKCLSFLFLYSLFIIFVLFFFHFQNFFYFHSTVFSFFFHFSATFYKIILFCPYFLVFAPCCFSSVIENFSIWCLFSHYRLLSSKLRNSSTP